MQQANEGRRSLEVESIPALGTLRSLRSKKTLSVGKRQETYYLSNDEKETWIEDYVETETAVATKWVQDAETAMMQEVKDMTTAENAGLTTRKPEIALKVMFNSIGDSLSDLANSDDEQIQHSMESFRLKQMVLDELTQPGWGDGANYFCGIDMMYGTAESKVLAVVTP